ncbi:MAG: hypothetical protein MHM6MM_004769 [Cercozoa sp. M6MM]
MDFDDDFDDIAMFDDEFEDFDDDKEETREQSSDQRKHSKAPSRARSAPSTQDLKENTARAMMQAAVKRKLFVSMVQRVQAATREESMTATPEFVYAVCEFAYKTMVAAAKDADAFCRHANRKKVAARDVLLYARNYPALQEAMEKRQEQWKKDNRVTSGSKRPRQSSGASVV